MAALVLYRQKDDGAIYATPESNYHVKMRTSIGDKTLNGVRMKNFATELIFNYTANNKAGELDFSEPLSVRIRISGSQYAQAQLADIVDTISAQLPEWMKQNVAIGFAPTSLPQLPPNL